MTLKQKLASGFTALALATSAVAATQAPQAGTAEPPHNMHGRRMGGRHMGFMMRGLNLTDAQKQFAKDLFKQNREATKAVREQLRANREQLTQAIKSNNEVEINRLTAANAQLKAQIDAARAKSMAKFYAQLTPDQKAKAEEARQQFRERMKNRMQRHAAGTTNG